MPSLPIPVVTQGKLNMSGNLKPVTNDSETQPLGEALQSVVEALQKLRFGAIQLTVHEGKLVQVDVTERRRFNS